MRIHEDSNGVRVNAISSKGGANVEGHVYQILAGTENADINFQLGPVQESGVNGVTNESLLAILIHRTTHIDRQFPCLENRSAISHMQDALNALEARTARRVQRGVEGQEIA